MCTSSDTPLMLGRPKARATVEMKSEYGSSESMTFSPPPLAATSDDGGGGTTINSQRGRSMDRNADDALDGEST